MPFSKTPICKSKIGQFLLIYLMSFFLLKPSASSKNEHLDLKYEGSFKKLEKLSQIHFSKNQMKDLLAILQAQAHLTSGNIEAAKEVTERAFQHATHLTINELVKLHTEITLTANPLGKAFDSTVFKKHLFKLLMQTPLELSTKDKERLSNRALNKIAKIPAKVSGISEKDILPPVPFKKDPLFKQNASIFCNQKKMNSGWKVWERKLPKIPKLYWGGLKASCLKQRRKSERLYSKAHKLAPKSQLHYAMLAKKAELKSIRSVGIRSGLLPLYMQICEIWKNKNFSTQKIGYSDFESLKFKANDFLWAARYSALNEKFSQARELAQFASKTLIQSRNKKISLRGKKELAVLEAEAFHILADRISIEEGKLKEALYYVASARKVPHLSDSWKEKFGWSEGFYSFLLGDSGRALKAWKFVLEETDDRVRKAQLLFWISKLKEGNSKNQTIAELQDHSPTHFYSIMARKNLMRSDELLPMLKDQKLISKLKNRAWNHQQKPKKKSKNDKSNLRFEINRLSLLASSDFESLGGRLAKSLYYNAKSQFSLKKNPALFVELSRLLFSLNQHPLSIVITSNLANQIEGFWKRWPEQVLIYFPKPYLHEYLTVSKQHSMDTNTLFAISRQESAFNATVKSNAGAYGLMQLILPNAKNLAKQINYNSKSLKSDLLKPRTNILFGSNYLKRLFRRLDGKSHAIYAAYNAGAFAVEKWLSNRPNKNSFVWIESIPYGETRSYTRNVWRNREVYDALDKYFKEQGQDIGNLRQKFAANLPATYLRQ